MIPNNSAVSSVFNGFVICTKYVLHFASKLLVNTDTISELIISLQSSVNWITIFSDKLNMRILFNRQIAPPFNNTLRCLFKILLCPNEFLFLSL